MKYYLVLLLGLILISQSNRTDAEEIEEQQLPVSHVTSIVVHRHGDIVYEVTALEGGVSALKVKCGLDDVKTAVEESKEVEGYNSLFVETPLWAEADSVDPDIIFTAFENAVHLKYLAFINPGKFGSVAFFRKLSSDARFRLNGFEPYLAIEKAG